MTTRARELRRRTGASDDGFAMASVLGIMLLGALIVSLMLTATIRSIGSTTATRASVQAKATAQSGIDDVRALLDAGSCVSGTVVGSGYTVRIHPSTGAEASASDPVGCPSSASRSVLLESTGSAAAIGVGNSSGDRRSVEALLVKPAGSPKFNKAAFGRNMVKLATNLRLGDASATSSADVFTEGTFTCSTNMIIEGDVYARDATLFSSAPCRVDGDVLTDGDFTCSSGTTIKGNLYVGGDATFSQSTCEVRGVVHVGGDVSMSNAGTKLGTSLIVGGQLSVSGLPATSVDTVVVGGRVNGGSGWWHSQMVTAYGARLSENATVSPPPAYPVDSGDEFPKLEANDPSIVDGFAPKSWRTTVTAGMVPLGWSPNPCSLESGETGFTSPIVISSNTRFDTTKASECAGGVTVGMGLWFELRADVVIVADRFNQNGPVRFSSGDGQKHSVYIVNPWPSGASTCTASGAAGIEFTSGVWTQDDKTSVLLYSARPIHVSTNPTFYGQMYGCTIVADTATNLTYLPAGSTVDPATMPWSLSYVRDRG